MERVLWAASYQPGVEQKPDSKHRYRKLIELIESKYVLFKPAVVALPCRKSKHSDEIIQVAASICLLLKQWNKIKGLPVLDHIFLNHV